MNEDGTWPRELPQRLPKTSNFLVYSFEYDSSDVTTLADLISHERIKRHANSLLAKLKAGGLVNNCTFVAHGYGGLICEKVGTL